MHQKIGLVESSIGLGIMVGHLQGGVLYDLCGYSCPFIINLILSVLFFPLIFYFIPNDRDINNILLVNSHVSNKNQHTYI
jgi:hypothetical protein